MQRIVRKTLLLPVGGVKKMFAWHLEMNNSAASGFCYKMHVWGFVAHWSGEKIILVLGG